MVKFMKSNFDEDLILGKKFELETKTILGGGDNLVIMDGYFPEYDIIDKDTGKKYEVKCCRRTLEKRNICIEYKYKGYFSGISKTTSDYYYYFPIDYYLEYYYYYVIPTSYIKELIKNKKWILDTKTENANIYLFPISLFSEYVIQSSNAICLV